MGMIKYCYKGFGRLSQIYLQFCGVLGITIFSSMGFFILAGLFYGPPVSRDTDLMNDPRLTIVCLGVVFIIFAWIMGSIFINAVPTIWLDERGITISTFLFFRKFIPWQNVIDIKPVRSPYNYLIVRARKITIFHHAIGWIYANSLYPAFLIADNIDDHHNLIRAIRRNLPWQKEKIVITI